MQQAGTGTKNPQFCYHPAVVPDDYVGQLVCLSFDGVCCMLLEQCRFACTRYGAVRRISV